MTGAYAQNWPGRGGWAPRGVRFAAEWSEREEQDLGERGEREERGRGGRGERRGRKGHRHHHHHGDAANWLFARGGGRHGVRPSPEEIEQLIAWRRMGGGPFGGPGGPFGRGGRGRARRGDVRLALLRLLSEQPANGYQLMQTIEERSGGRWRPSPGSVYPTLSQLEDEGLIKSVEADGSRRFEITDAGREHMESRAGEPEPWRAADEEGENAITELAPLVIQIGKAAWQVATVGDEAQRARAIELLAETRRALYRILAEDAPDVEEADDADNADDSGESDA